MALIWSLERGLRNCTVRAAPGRDAVMVVAGMLEVRPYQIRAAVFGGWSSLKRACDGRYGVRRKRVREIWKPSRG